MNMHRKRQRRQRVLVVLEGAKASTNERGAAPLKWALREVVENKDEVLVLAILNPLDLVASPYVGSFCCMGGDPLHSYIKFSHDQINQRRKAYLEILRPYYQRCKATGVKFQVKVAVGIRPIAIMFEEAIDFKATWIIMDRCFGGDKSLRDDFNIALVNDNGEAEERNYQATGERQRESQAEGERTSLLRRAGHIHDDLFSSNPKSPKLLKESVSEEEPHIRDSLPTAKVENRPFRPSVLANISETEIRVESLTDETENPTMPVNGTTICDSRFSEAMAVLRQPVELSWVHIQELAKGFHPGSCISKHNDFDLYDGFLTNPYRHATFKKLNGDSTGIVEAEKRITCSLFHRSIMRLSAYHEGTNATVLVHSATEKGTLDQYIYGYREEQRELTFKDRMKIVAEIGRCLRYLHEECPRGPVVHTNLLPHNIFLTRDFQPLLSGFGHAIWVQSDQRQNGSTYRYSSVYRSMEQMKSDVFAFGVLLLRLFCQRTLPKDDNQLVELARPLLKQGAFHDLLGQDMEDLDMYEIYRVMSAALLCTKTEPHSRPSMSQVVSILTGENSSILGLSPSSDGSLHGGNIWS